MSAGLGPANRPLAQCRANIQQLGAEEICADTISVVRLYGGRRPCREHVLDWAVNAAWKTLRKLQIICTVYGKFYNSWSLLKIVPVLYRSAPFIGEEVGGLVEATSSFGRGCRVEDVEVAANKHENNLPAS